VGEVPEGTLEALRSGDLSLGVDGSWGARPRCGRGENRDSVVPGGGSMSGLSGSTVDRFAHFGTAAVVVLLHALMIGLFVRALQLGTLVIPLPDAHSSVPLKPEETPVKASIVSAAGHDTSGSPFEDADLSRGSLTDIAVDIPEPRDFLMEVEPITAAAPSATAYSGEVRILCEVHIHQSVSGEVQAIDLGGCSGDSLWQRSLLQSIQQAARLVSPTLEGRFPPVRTLMLDTASLSPEVLARQLSEPDALP
jgi:hypothetical protein